MIWFLLSPLSLGLSLAVGATYVRNAGRWGLVDMPSARSSHVTPTPRGGGVAFVVPAVLVMLVLATTVGDERFYLSLALASTALAVIGFLDDRLDLPPWLRLLSQAGCMGTVIWGADGLPLLLTASTTVMGPLALAMTFVGGVWFINLYNFMDGLDGLASGQAVILGLTGAWLLAPGDPALAALCLALAFGVVGFLRFNWSPARMFMGDAGSLFLGLVIAAIGIRASVDTVPLVMWFLPVAGLIVDATATLLWRLAHGRSPVQAHRDHAYQRLHRIGWSHTRVSLCYGALAASGAVVAILAQSRAHLLLPLTMTFGGVLLILWACVLSASTRKA